MTTMSSGTVCCNSEYRFCSRRVLVVGGDDAELPSAGYCPCTGVRQERQRACGNHGGTDIPVGDQTKSSCVLFTIIVTQTALRWSRRDRETGRMQTQAGRAGAASRGALRRARGLLRVVAVAVSPTMTADSAEPLAG
jgi:hypothetical protein